MKQTTNDLTIRANADKSRNKTAMAGITIMNLILVVAYLLEVVKGARTVGSYALIAAFCILP